MDTLNLINILYLSIWAYCIFLPIYTYYGIEQEKQKIAQSANHRLTMYSETIVMLWLPIGLIAAYMYLDNMPLAHIGLVWHWSLNQMIGLAVIAAITGYFYWSLKQQNWQDEAEINQLKQQFNDLHWMMPSDKKQTGLFCAGVSVSAGVCEEIIYRGFVLSQLSVHLPTYWAVIISSLLFGLGHWYQGGIHILRTAALGALMAICYLLTDSLLIPILLHIIIDVYGGLLGYQFNKHVTDFSPQPLASAQSK